MLREVDVHVFSIRPNPIGDCSERMTGLSTVTSVVPLQLSGLSSSFILLTEPQYADFEVVFLSTPSVDLMKSTFTYADY